MAFVVDDTAAPGEKTATAMKVGSMFGERAAHRVLFAKARTK